jgi:hypothetical protein
MFELFLTTLTAYHVTVARGVTWDVLTLMRLVSWLKAWTCSDKGLLLLMGRWFHQPGCPLGKELCLDV